MDTHNRKTKMAALAVAQTEQPSTYMIQRLPDDIIARIAAGEVITSPYNIVKELVENSIDASSTYITVKIGSTLGSLTVSDNGCGILLDDFSKVCERHCTSKYTGNLLSLTTFGFRGEALSSISLVSKVTIESKRKADEIGYKAVYNGNALHYTKKQPMKDGTTVIIEDIFANNKIRKKYFYKRKDELDKIYYLISNYSIFNTEIVFLIYKDDILLNKNICVSSKSSKIERKKLLIKNIYKINAQLCEYADDYFFLLHSNITHYSNTFVFVLFINKRLVDNKILKGKIKNLYTPHIPKNKYPFVYIELSINSENVDVNVHPEKKEVLFLDEEKIYQMILDRIETNMQERINIEQIKKEKSQNLALATQNTSINPDIANSQRQIVYTNPENSSIIDIFSNQHFQTTTNATQKVFLLQSIKSRKDKIQKTDDFYPEKLVNIGLYSDYTIMQYESLLLLCNSAVLVKSYFYQRLILDFGNFRSKEIRIKYNEEFTQNHIQILSEYFGFAFDNDHILKIPIIGKTSIDDGLDTFLQAFAKIELVNEDKVFDSLFLLLTLLFAKNYTNDDSNFDILKRSVIVTKALKTEFKILTSLHELYKLFERC